MPIVTRRMYVSQKARGSPFLPGEIWYHIARFIPLSSFSSHRLYALNRSFLAFYLDAKYRNFNLSYNSCLSHLPPSSLLHQQLDYLLTAPLIAHIPQSLEIDLREDATIRETQFLSTSKYFYKGKWFRKPCGMVRAIAFWKKKNWPPSLHEFTNFPPAESFAASLSHLRNLTSLKCYIGTSYQNFPSMLDLGEVVSLMLPAAWKASSASLTTLHLCFYLMEFPSIPFDEAHFPNLHDLKLHLLPQWGYWYRERASSQAQSLRWAQGSILRFFLRHQQTITHLSFAFAPSHVDADILIQMPIFPCLIDLEFNTSLVPASPTLGPLVSFVKNHAAQLEKLSPNTIFFRGNFPGDEHDDNDPLPTWRKMEEYLGQIHYPRLKSIQLLEADPSIMWITPQTAASIIDLDLGQSGEERYFGEIIRLFKQRSNGARELRALRISTGALNRVVIQFAMQELPMLKSLYITHYGVPLGYRAEKLADRLSSALQELKDSRFHGWGLEQLYLHNDRHMYQIDRVEFREVIVQAFTSVKYFNGVTSKEFIDMAYQID